MSLTSTIIKKTFRVPFPKGNKGISTKLASKCDAALIQVGFKLSPELLHKLSNLNPILAVDLCKDILLAVQTLVGDHVKHNSYFKQFPNNIPDTDEFWSECIRDALRTPGVQNVVELQLSYGCVNLLDLPKYGKYQHTYEDMVAIHEKFLVSTLNKFKVLALGDTLQEESYSLYVSLAGSKVPLNEDDRKLLLELAELHQTDKQPEIPIRENKALINKVLVEAHRPLLIDTVTDILRLACVLSDGDVTLEKVTKFKSFPKYQRRAMLESLNSLLKSSPDKRIDGNLYVERWKRLAERLHGSYIKYYYSAVFFDNVAKNYLPRSVNSQVNALLEGNNPLDAFRLLADTSPGLLFRNLDRFIRYTFEASGEKVDFNIVHIIRLVKSIIPKVSGRVILSVREHLLNRLTRKNNKRIFVNKAGKSWVKDEDRGVLDKQIVKPLLKIFDDELKSRIPKVHRLVVDSNILNCALPISEKSKSEGYGIMPRGSTYKLESDILRFFVYWRQKEKITDYDLSVLLLDEDFVDVGQISWTNLRDEATGVHSGDITSAPKGASEFIDINLKKSIAKYVVPQVNIFAGEDFNTVAEAFFGFMELDRKQHGKPFEPQAVTMKSDLRGEGKVSLPLVFIHEDDGTWTAKWMHLYLKTRVSYNKVENNKANTSLLAKAITNREYLTIQYISTLYKKNSIFDANKQYKRPVYYVGLSIPDYKFPEGSKILTLNSLKELIPE